MIRASDLTLVYSRIKNSKKASGASAISPTASALSALTESGSVPSKKVNVTYTHNKTHLPGIEMVTLFFNEMSARALKEFSLSQDFSFFRTQREDITLKVIKMQTEWSNLLKQTSYSLNEMLKFYQTTKECILAGEQFFYNISPTDYPTANAKNHYPFKIKKLVKNMLWIAHTLQKAVFDIINTIVNFKILEKVEILYKNSTNANMLEVDSIKSEDAYWKKVTERMYDVFSIAFLQVKQEPDYSKYIPSLTPSNQKALIASQLQLLKKRSQLLIFFSHLAESTHSTFLRHMNQGKQVFTQFSGMQCMGVVIEWGLKLHMHPPLQAGTPSEHFQVFLSFINTLKKREFPKFWHCVDTLLGDPVCTVQTMEYQRKAFDLFIQTGIQCHRTETCSAQEIMKMANILFSKRSSTTVSVLAITLNTKMEDDYSPHMIAISQIYLPKSDHMKSTEKTVYRLCDADYAEFEAYSKDDFEVLLTAYFNRLNYSTLFCNASLQNIDPAIKYLQKIQGMGKNLIEDHSKSSTKSSIKTI